MLEDKNFSLKGNTITIDNTNTLVKGKEKTILLKDDEPIFNYNLFIEKLREKFGYNYHKIGPNSTEDKFVNNEKWINKEGISFNETDSNNGNTAVPVAGSSSSSSIPNNTNIDPSLLNNVINKENCTIDDLHDAVNKRIEQLNKDYLKYKSSALDKAEIIYKEMNTPELLNIHKKDLEQLYYLKKNPEELYKDEESLRIFNPTLTALEVFINNKNLPLEEVKNCFIKALDLSNKKEGFIYVKHAFLNDITEKQVECIRAKEKEDLDNFNKFKNRYIDAYEWRTNHINIKEKTHKDLSALEERKNKLMSMLHHATRGKYDTSFSQTRKVDPLVRTRVLASGNILVSDGIKLKDKIIEKRSPVIPISPEEAENRERALLRKREMNKRKRELMDYKNEENKRRRR